MSDTQTEVQTEVTDLSAEQQTQVEPPKAPDHSWVPKRISEITAARRAAEQRAADNEARALRAEQELERLRAGSQPTETPTHTAAAARPEDIDRLAEALAERKMRDREASVSMNQRIDAINEAGVKEYGDEYQKSINNLQLAGVGGPDFLRVLANVPNAEAVVTFLGHADNVGEAMRIASLDPAAMGIELMKKVPDAKKALTKGISKAPAPISSVDGGSGGADDSTEPDPKDTAKWMAWRNKNKRRR